MPIKCGTDIIEIHRVSEAIENERFIKRVFSDDEIAYCERKGKSKTQSYAARFAGKEAVSKALGTGFSKGVTYKDIEICNDNNNAPSVRLKGGALKRYNDLNAKSIEISLSHSGEHAIAFVVIEI